MTIPDQDLETQVLSLPPEERARLLERLLASLEPACLEPAPSEVQHAWIEAARRRRAEVEEGRISMIPGDEALARVRARLA